MSVEKVDTVVVGAGVVGLGPVRRQADMTEDHGAR